MLRNSVKSLFYALVLLLIGCCLSATVVVPYVTAADNLDEAFVKMKARINGEDVGEIELTTRPEEVLESDGLRREFRNYFGMEKTAASKSRLVYNWCYEYKFHDAPESLDIIDLSMKERIISQKTQQFNQRYPNSQINCLTMSGSFTLGDGQNIYLKQGRVTSVYYAIPGNPITTSVAVKSPTECSVNVSNQHNNNYLIYTLNKETMTFRFYDARLPITLNSNLSINSDKTYALSRNELMDALENVYYNVFAPQNTTIQEFAYRLLTSSNSLDEFEQLARQEYKNRQKSMIKPVPTTSMAPLIPKREWVPAGSEK